jgi:signal transduction histidine kinase
MKIKTRLWIYFMLLVMFIVSISFIILYYSINRSSEINFYSRLKAKAITTAQRRLYIKEVDSLLLAKIDKEERDIYKDENISVYDSTDREIYTNNDTVYYPLTAMLFDRIRIQSDTHYTMGKVNIVAFTYNLQGQKNIVIAGGENKDRDATLKELRRKLFYLFFISMFMMGVSGWYFASQALAPISDIIHKVATLSPIEHSERLTTLTEKDEIAGLVNTFNQLFDKLEESFKLQRYFMANISHEMNNPLTKIKSQIEVSLMHNREKEDYKEILQSILEDVNELTVLIQDMMKFSKVSQGSLVYEPFRIDEMLFEIRDSIMANSPDYHINISFTNPPNNDKSLICQANKPLIITAIKNIVENACKYSPDQAAFLALIVRGDSIVLSVYNNGSGIPIDDLPYIFDLFFRSPSMESVKGYGIGLALAQKIIKAHGFDISVQSELGRGTTFFVTFSS